MANTCAICGATINVLQSQKLMDGNYICTKGCRAKGLKYYDKIFNLLKEMGIFIKLRWVLRFGKI